MKILSRFKISNVLIVVITVFTIVLLVPQSIAVYSKTSRLISDKICKQSLETSRQISQRISNALNSVEQIALSLVLSEELRSFIVMDDDAEYYEQILITDKMGIALSNIANTQKSISDIVILTDKLDIYNYATPNSFFEMSRVVNKPFWKYIEKSDSGYIPTQPNIFLSYSSHKNIITYFQKIYDDNKLLAVLCINIDEQYIRDILADSEDNSNHLVIVDNERNPITPFYQDGVDNTIWNTIYAKLNSLSDEESQHDMYIDNHKYLCIQENIVNHWKLVHLKSYDEITSGINSIAQTLVIIALVCFVLSFLFITYFSRAITIPIRNLILETKKVGEGNFDVVLDESYKNEIGGINKHLNRIIKQLKSLINEIQNNQIKIKESELQALQAQINPHFLYNTLDSINWMAINIGADNISNMTSNLGTFFRLSLNKGKSITSLKKEFEHLRAYLSIQEYRYNHSFSYVEEIDENVLDYSTVNLILQPLVENSLIHGAENCEGKCEIIISAYFEDDDIFIQVMDDGCGCNHEFLNECLKADVNMSKGYGVKNVDQRIKIQFGQEYGIKYLSRNIGTCVEIHLPKIIFDDDIGTA